VITAAICIALIIVHAVAIDILVGCWVERSMEKERAQRRKMLERRADYEWKRFLERYFDEKAENREVNSQKHRSRQ